MVKAKHWFSNNSVRIGIAVLIAVIALIYFITRGTDTMQLSQRDSLVAKMGIDSVEPKKLSSYQQVEGVLNIQHWTTKQGVRVYFVEVPALPMVDVQVSFDAGAARNGEKGGLSYLTNQMLTDGTAKLSADQIAEGFENVGAQVNVEAQRDVAKIDMRSLSNPDQLIPALDTLREVLASPAFPEQEFKRQQQQALVVLKQQSQTPQQIASRAFYEALYSNQPYGGWILGNEASIKAMTVADLKAFHQKYYVAKNAIVTIVGNLSARDADAIAQKLTNQLPEGEKAPTIAAVTDLKQGIVKKVNFPSAQTHILMGEPGVKQGDPDFYALNVGNHILGGNGSVTRLFNTVRNQHGLAYSVYSYFIPMRERGPFVLGCQTRNDQAEKALGLIQTSLIDFIEKGPTTAEVDAAKQNLLGGYALQFDSNASICSQVAALGFYGLPLDYFNQFKPAVEKITAADVKKAFQNRIKPKDMVIVMVGGAASGAQEKGNG